jgi:hypothetical protein
MSSSTQLSHPPTKDFDLVFVEDRVIAESLSAYKESRPAATTPKPSSFDPESLRLFHEEFKRLVLEFSSEHAAEEATGLQEVVEPHEIAWLNWLADDNAPVADTQPESPKQVVKPQSGPRPGTPPAAERWVVKVIAVLIGLNLLFAGLIVSGLQVSDWRHWLQA